MDPARQRAVPVQQTMLLVNNFIVNTTKFLNNFSAACESKLGAVSARISRMQVTLSLLEAKINSVPGLEFSEEDMPATSSATAAAPEPSAPPAQTEDQQQPPQPQQTEQQQSAEEQAMEADADNVEGGEAEDPNVGMVKVKDHPDYAKFFRLLQVGVPEAQVRHKMQVEGVDPNLLYSGDQLVAAPPQEAGEDDEMM